MTLWEWVMVVMMVVMLCGWIMLYGRLMYNMGRKKREGLDKCFGMAIREYWDSKLGEYLKPCDPRWDYEEYRRVACVKKGEGG